MPQSGRQFSVSARVNIGPQHGTTMQKQQSHTPPDSRLVTSTLASQGSGEKTDFSINGAASAECSC